MAQRLTDMDQIVHTYTYGSGDGQRLKKIGPVRHQGGKVKCINRSRAQNAANAWRAVEGVMADRRISKRLNGKVMSTCVTGMPSTCVRNGILALTEIQQHRLQVCENNWVRKIARVKRADRRRMMELRE